MQLMCTIVIKKIISHQIIILLLIGNNVVNLNIVWKSCTHKIGKRSFLA